MSPRRVRFPAAVDVPASSVPVPSIGPVVFSLRFDAEEVHYDFSQAPCPRLMRPLAAALSQLGGDDGPLRRRNDFGQKARAIRLFVDFVAAAEPEQATEFGLDDLEPELLDAFEEHLARAFPEGSGQPYAVLSTVARVLRLAYETAPDSFSAEMHGRIGYTATTTEPPASKPLDAYPVPVFERIETAALDDVRKIRDRILRGERLAEQGQDPNFGGWGRLENVLWHVARHGPLTNAVVRQHRPLRALGGARAVNSHLFLTKADMVPFLSLLICQTGLEPECAKTLRADCLVNPSRGFVSIAYVKKRAHHRTHKTMRVSNGGALHYPGGLVRLALRLTQRAREFAGTDALWVLSVDAGVRDVYLSGVTHTARDALPWLARHQIDQMKDRGGGPVSMDTRRLRKSHKSRNYLRAGGILDDFVSGHTKEVAAKHYADIEAHREVHEQAVENGLQEALDVALAPPVVLDDDGSRLDEGEQELEPQEVLAALGTDNDVWLASCRDYYASPWARKKGAGCPVAIWGCLECPNAVFTTRHLPSLLSFLDFLEEQRSEYSVAEWKARYGLAWERIVDGVRPKFSNTQIATAKAIAEAAGPRLSLPAQFLELTT
ncbi:hypothetical protein A6A28_16795 [Streptomyces sp. CB03578]|uniref:hypothetical protein n=1 Tax=Streptomyces sp. CB03578 TaxID=1718987 RepID=UPI00093EED13|nr:hypothetical protein [Streptomyces sp. CB03578]OKI26628.1 hypothetical protein A6A28_16795 [Streptomyces sp. CB03578]